MSFPSVACAILLVAVIALSVKLYSVKKATRDIISEFNERIKNDTNTLITTDCGDSDIKKLAAKINKSLAELRKEKYRLRQSDAELKDAVTNISHDLRTPLTAICGYLELLEREEKSEAVNRYLEVIQDRADLLIHLTEELFRYSVIMSVSENESEAVCLNALIEESLATFYAQLSEQGIAPEVSIPEVRVIRNLDRSAMTRVLSNLISNAIQHGGDSLSVILTENGEIVFRNPAPELTEVELGRLFDRFYTVSAARKSTGLGLAIARTLTEQMGGKITARQENGDLVIEIRL